MTLARRNPKRDTAEREVVAAIRRIGGYVYRLSGEGIPDLLVGYKRAWYLLEVKTGKRRPTQAQQYFLNECCLVGLPAYVVRDAAEAIDILQPGCRI